MFNTLETFQNWEQIKKKLEDMRNKKQGHTQIIQSLKMFQYYSSIGIAKVNKHSPSSFSYLQKLYKNDLPDIFSKIAAFVLDRPKHIIPLFYQNQNKSHTFKKQTILYLLCSMALCLIPPQQFDKSLEKRAKFNFLLDCSYIFDEQSYKTSTVIEYIKQEIDNVQTFDQTFSIERQVENRTVQEIINQSSNKKMCKLDFRQDKESIQDFCGDLKADFANKFLGGGALMSGCVQQEIMFTNHPQLFTAQLLCQVMNPSECIFLSGYKKYFKNIGYGYTAAYDGKQTLKYEYSQQKMAKEYITAIDAIPFGGANQNYQYEKGYIDREIKKAFCGFNFKNAQVKRVVTGNWGCGAFGGNLQMKFLIQWLACSAADKQLVYCPFGSRKQIFYEPVINKFSQLSVLQAYNLLNQASARLLQEKQSNIYKIIDLL